MLTLTIGPGKLTIPAGSFQRSSHTLVFRGNVAGVSVDAVIDQANKNKYFFKIDGDGLDLTGVKNQVTIGLQIGNNAGTKSIKTHIH